MTWQEKLQALRLRYHTDADLAEAIPTSVSEGHVGNLAREDDPGISSRTREAIETQYERVSASDAIGREALLQSLQTVQALREADSVSDVKTKLDRLETFLHRKLDDLPLDVPDYYTH